MVMAEPRRFPPAAALLLQPPPPPPPPPAQPSPRGASVPVRVGFYEIEGTLGKGNFAVVKLGRHRITRSELMMFSCLESKTKEGERDQLLTNFTFFVPSKETLRRPAVGLICRHIFKV